jgi:CSLREA domain-containing protein
VLQSLLAAALFVVGMTFWITPPIQASAFTVNATVDGVDARPGDGRCATRQGSCTLRAAIQEANAIPGRDVITLPPQTLTLSLGGPSEDGAAYGDLDVTDALTIVGASPGTTIISAGTGASSTGDRVLHVLPNVDVDLSDVTVRDGLSYSEGQGGGIRNQGNLTLRGGAVLDNSAGDVFSRGGGIVNTGTLSLDGTRIAGNNASTDGGGLLNWGTATLRRVTVSSNGVWFWEECGLRAGGGGIDNRGSLELTDSRITANGAPFRGGGIENAGTLRVLRSTVDGNSTVSGGGIWNSGRLTLDNSTISGNIVREPAYALRSCGAANTPTGGGIANFGTTVLANTTVALNRGATYGTNLSNWGPDTYSTPSTTPVMALTNSLIGPPGSAGQSCAVAVPIVSLGYNLDAGDSCLLRSTGDRVAADPRLADLASNGGHAPTHALGSGSAAIDRGVTSGCPYTDQRNVLRPIDGDRNGTARCDIGAFEMSPGFELLAPAPRVIAVPVKLF